MSEKHLSPIIPIAISILAFIGWCIFILWYTLFWSSSFTLFQNIVIGLISLLIVGGFLGLMWVIWGFKTAGWRMPRPDSTAAMSTASTPA